MIEIKVKKIVFIATWVAFCILFSGCKVTENKTGTLRSVSPIINNQPSRVSVFLNLKNQVSSPATIEIDSTEIKEGDVWKPISTGPVVINTAKLGQGQVFLGSSGLPVGVYDSLRFNFSTGKSSSPKSVPIAETSKKTEISLKTPLHLSRGDSKTLLVVLDVESSMVKSQEFSPVLTIKKPLIPLPVNLLFVACPEIDTIFQVCASTDTVCGSIGVKGKPTYLGIDRSRNRLLVLAEDQGAIKIIDLVTNKVINSLKIPMIIEPSFMAISDDGELAFVLEEKRNFLYRLNLVSGDLEERVSIGQHPHYLTYLEEHGLLAISSELSQSIIFVNSETLKKTAEISVGGSPQGMAVANGQLYIAENQTNSVSILNPQTRLVQGRVSVGMAPRRLLSTSQKIYCNNSRGKSISVLRQNGLGAIQTIKLNDVPLEMAFHYRHNRLFVGEKNTVGIRIIDTNINRAVGHIPLGAEPLGLAFIQ